MGCRFGAVLYAPLPLCVDAYVFDVERVAASGGEEVIPYGVRGVNYTVRDTVR